jgi:hypothetical protein
MDLFVLPSRFMGDPPEPLSFFFDVLSYIFEVISDEEPPAINL